MRELVRELRVATRTLGQARGFAAIAIVILALGIAANVTIFALVNAYLLRSLPYPASDRLYTVVYAPPGQEHPRGMEKLDWSPLEGLFEHFIAWDLDMFFVVGGEYPDRLPGAWVTPGFMEGLGVTPALGRAFSPEEYAPGAPQVALISHSMWQGRFGGDPGVVGRTFQAYVSDRPEEAELFTIVGVLPAGFWHINPYTNVFAPLRAPSYPYLVRLRPGVSVAGAEQRLTEFVRSGVGSHPSGGRIRLQSAHGAYAERVRPVLLATAVAGGLILLIACANVAFLILVRTVGREKEIAVRMALGAGRLRIARMLAAEGLVLGAAATAAGLALTWLALDWIAPVVQRQLGRPVPGGLSAVAIDGAVLGAAAGCCIVTSLLFTLAPLLACRSTGLVRAMQSGGRSVTDGPASRRMRAGLIALEMAGALAILTGCGLMLRSVARMTSVDLGMAIESVSSAGITLRQRSYPDAAACLAFYERLLPDLAGVPGVQSAALSDWWPLQQPRRSTVRAEMEGGLRPAEAGILAVSRHYHEVLGIRVLEGRTFTRADRGGSEPVAVVSRTVADRLWPGRSATGQRLLTPGRRVREGEAPEVWRTVVGVVSDVRQTHADDDQADVYVPFLQTPGPFAMVYLRTGTAGPEFLRNVRAALRALDPEVSLGEPRSLSGFIEEQLSRPRFLTSLLAGFGLFAALVALLGVYGVISYTVRQREREIAVRMAVGADAAAVSRLFVRGGMCVLAIGISGGILGGLGIGRVLKSQLFDVRSSDPVALSAAALSFAAAGILAVWWSARRAARMDPAAALHEE